MWNLANDGCHIDSPDAYESESDIDPHSDSLKDQAQEALLRLQNKCPNVENYPKTQEVIKHYLSLDARSRGYDSIASDVDSVIDFINENPQSLTWIEEISQYYLDDCVNQQVAGFSELSAWVEIARPNELIEKIEAAKRLMIMTEIESFAAKSTDLGLELKAEGVNYLAMKVHDQLVKEEVIKPWLGSPESIAYERLVRGWGTQDKVDEMCIIAKEILQKNPSDVVEYLCNKDKSDTWFQVAFPEQRDAALMEFKGHEKLEALMEAFDKLSYEDLKRKVETLDSDVPVDSLDDISRNALKIKVNKIEAAALEIEKSQFMISSVTALTQDAIARHTAPASESSPLTSFDLLAFDLLADLDNLDETQDSSMFHAIAGENNDQSFEDYFSGNMEDNNTPSRKRSRSESSSISEASASSLSKKQKNDNHSL